MKGRTLNEGGSGREGWVRTRLHDCSSLWGNLFRQEPQLVRKLFPQVRFVRWRILTQLRERINGIT